MKNTGKRAGKEVVQFYLSAPTATMDKPVEELKGFAKTKLLQPGQSETITITLTPDELASFDETKNAWIAEQGRYTVKVGNSSRHFMQNATFTLDKDIIVEQCK